jgi:hypothetical protein
VPYHLTRSSNFTSRAEANVFAPKFGTRPIRLTPLVRSVSHNGLTGWVSCSRSGNGHNGLTGGPDRSDRWTLSPSRIVESLRISSCKRIPCGARPPQPINIKGHGRLRGHHPINHYFLQFYLSNPSFSNLVLSLFVLTTIRDVLSGLANLRATLGTPPLTGSLLRRRS